MPDTYCVSMSAIVSHRSILPKNAINPLIDEFGAIVSQINEKLEIKQIIIRVELN